MQTISKNETTTYTHSVVHHLPVSDEMLKKIRHETNLDPIMQAISKYLSHGCPNKIHKVETPAHLYYKIWNKLSEHEGVILKGSRTVILTTLWKWMKQILHIGHLGTERTKVNAKGNHVLAKHKHWHWKYGHKLYWMSNLSQQTRKRDPIATHCPWKAMEKSGTWWFVSLF